MAEVSWRHLGELSIRHRKEFVRLVGALDAFGIHHMVHNRFAISVTFALLVLYR